MLVTTTESSTSSDSESPCPKRNPSRHQGEHQKHWGKMHEHKHHGHHHGYKHGQHHGPRMWLGSHHGQYVPHHGSRHGFHHGPRHRPQDAPQSHHWHHRGPYQGHHHGPSHGHHHGTNLGPHHDFDHCKRSKKIYGLVEKYNKKLHKKIYKNNKDFCGQNMVLISEDLLNMLCSRNYVSPTTPDVSNAEPGTVQETFTIPDETDNAVAGENLAEDMSNLQVTKE